MTNYRGGQKNRLASKDHVYRSSTEAAGKRHIINNRQGVQLNFLFLWYKLISTHFKFSCKSKKFYQWN